MENETIQHLFDQYLRGELSDSEKSEFEKELEENEQLRKKLKKYENIVQGIKEYSKENFKKNLNEIDKSAENYHTKKTKRYRFLKYAASILIILSLGLYYLHFIPSKEEKLFEEYFTPYPNDLTEHSRGASLAGEWQNLSNGQYRAVIMAMNHYDREEYQEAAKIFNGLQFTDDYPAILFFHALSEITIGNSQEALHKLELLTNKSDNKYLTPSRWYLALLYLRTNQIEASKQLLKEIKDTRSEFSAKAASLLSEINS